MSRVSTASDLARALVTELVRSGVRHVVLCPGSRSAPLAYAVYDAAQAQALTLHVRHDERVAGFTALGVGRSSGRPAAVITTSGTAVANLHPAVLEAHHAGVPLLVLAADRPRRLRGTWANQTSDLQAEIFGGATRFAVDLDPAGGFGDWAEATRAAIRSAAGADGGRPGPALLNLGFDEPLLPADDEPWFEPIEPIEPPVLSESRGSRPADGLPGRADRAESALGSDAALDLADGRRTVVVAGDGAWSRSRELAEWLRAPLLAEPTSGARSGPQAIGPYRLLLDRPDLGGRIERVVVTGRPTLSRPVTRLLDRPDVEVVIVPAHEAEPGPERQDAVRVMSGALAPLLSEEPPPAPAGWLSGWQAAGQAASAAIDVVLDGWPRLTGPLVAREVVAAGREGDNLVLAASNPVRDADLAAPSVHASYAVANRGVSGIDGTVSTAIGVALGSGRPTRVLVGDVAFLHDLGALVLGPHERVPDLTIVVLNDAGGGIFSLLEQGQQAGAGPAAAARFERVFGTPHAVDLAAVSAGLGVPHVLAGDSSALREELARPPQGVRVVEVRADRADLRALQVALDQAVQAAVSA